MREGGRVRRRTLGGGSQNIKGEHEEDQSLPTEDMGGGGVGN